MQVMALCQWALGSALAITGAFELLQDKPHINAPLAIAMAVAGGVLIIFLVAMRCSCCSKRKQVNDYRSRLRDGMV